MTNAEVQKFIDEQWEFRAHGVKDEFDHNVRYVCERNHFEAAIRDTLRHAASICAEYGGLDGAYCSSRQLREMADSTLDA